MNELNPNLVVGYDQLAKILSTSAGALSVRKTRGKLPLEPLFYIGRTAVFNRQQAVDLAKQEQAKQER